MAKSDKNIVQWLLRILGKQSVDTYQAEPDQQPQNPLDNEMTVQFTESELHYLTKKQQNQKGSNQQREHLLHTIIENLSATSKTIGEQVNINSQMAGLAPEIIQARRIYTSSIMSPNDMQTGRVAITVNDPNGDTGLTEEQKTELATMLTEFFNDEVNLADKLEDWIGTCLFESGSQPVAVVPRQDIKNLTDNVEVVTEDLLDDENLMDDCIASLEQDESFKSVESDSKTQDVVKQAQDALKKITKYYGKMEKGTPLRVTSNIQDINQKDKKVKEEVEKHTDQTMNFREGSIYLLQTPSDYNEDDRPTVVELPSEAVIPIGLPGSRKTHIGYFILTDKWGEPMKYNPSDVSTQNISNDTLVNKSYNTIIGDSMGSVWKNMKEDQKWNAMNTVFNVVVNQMMQQHVTKDKELNMSIGQSNNVSNCILYNTLRGKKMKLVFVPEPLMSYYAFDYRNDGTGKTLLEDIQGPLSLRVTLMVARVMGELENAINEKTVTMNIDEKNTNPEQTISMVKDIFMKKNMLNLSNLDPSSISADVASKSISVVPKGLTGIDDDLTIEKSSESGNKSEVDEELMERLTKMAITGIGVPYSALNELSENEYSRTIATVNLMFSNIIRNMQHALEPHNNKFVRNYCHMSNNVRDKIQKHLKEKPEEEESHDDGVSGEEKQLVEAVINHLSVDLPAPNVATSTAQFEEIEDFISTIDTVTEEMFSEDMVMSDDSIDEDQLIALKQFVKASIIRNYMSTLSTNIFDVPGLEEFVDEHGVDVAKFQQLIQNFKKRVQDLRNSIAPEGEEGGESGGGGGGFGF